MFAFSFCLMKIALLLFHMNIFEVLALFYYIALYALTNSCDLVLVTPQITSIRIGNPVYLSYVHNQHLSHHKQHLTKTPEN